jgi:hypothetical protein
MMTAASAAAAKVMASLSAGGDASRILQAAEHTLGEIALAIGNLVERMTVLAAWVVRNDRDRSPLERDRCSPSLS